MGEVGRRSCALIGGWRFFEADHNSLPPPRSLVNCKWQAVLPLSESGVSFSKVTQF